MPSGVLGWSSLVDLADAADDAAEPTVLSPFYLPGSPRRNIGEQIGCLQDGGPVLARRHVTDRGGTPLARASPDIWQSSVNGLCDTQDPGQPPFNLRRSASTLVSRAVRNSSSSRTASAARPVCRPTPGRG